MFAAVARIAEAETDVNEVRSLLDRCRDHPKSALKVQTTALITSISFALQPFGAVVGVEITLKALLSHQKTGFNTLFAFFLFSLF
jgi:hypothetical protein